MFESFCLYNNVALPENDFILTLEFRVGPPGKDHKLLSQQSASSPPLLKVLSHIINAFTNANSLPSIIADTKICEQICQRNAHFYSLLPSLLRTINQSLSRYQFTDRDSRTIISLSYRTCDERVIFWKVVEEYHPQAKPKNRHECIFVTIPQNT